MKQPDPWADIARPVSGYTARRIDPTHPGHLFWARDADGRAALLLRYDASAATADPRPALHGVDILEPPENEGLGTLVLVLKSHEDLEIFLQLCRDIIETTRSCGGDAAVLSSVILRTWKWHRLLRGSADPRLGPEEQQGLIGELLVAERLLASYAATAVMSFWRGPLDEPKDFVLEDRAIEVKARHLTKEMVRISSEEQLQLNPGQALFLVVSSLSPADPATPGAFTLDELVDRLGARLKAHPSAAVVFESRLKDARYSGDHDYSDAWWAEIGLSAYEVTPHFPRIEATQLAPGVSGVRYDLMLEACDSYATPLEPVLEPGLP